MGQSIYGIAWSKEYELGEELVDSQHKRLFELVDTIGRACAEGTDAEILNETLDFLLNYTVQHFVDEEALQLSCGYPDYQRHKKLHDEFEETVKEKVAEYRANGSTKELSDTVTKVIVRWLVNHILKEDKRIAQYIKK